jgi:hypothetical protein
MDEFNKKFTFFWFDGKSEVLEGFDEICALSHAGYGSGALKALDFWDNGDVRDQYKWSPETHNWIKSQ